MVESQPRRSNIKSQFRQRHVCFTSVTSITFAIYMFGRSTRNEIYGCSRRFDVSLSQANTNSPYRAHWPATHLHFHPRTCFGLFVLLQNTDLAWTVLKCVELLPTSLATNMEAIRVHYFWHQKLTIWFHLSLHAMIFIFEFPIASPSSTSASSLQLEPQT